LEDIRDVGGAEMIAFRLAEPNKLAVAYFDGA